MEEGKGRILGCATEKGKYKCKNKKLQVHLRFIQFACTVDQSDYLLRIAALQKLI